VTALTCARSNIAIEAMNQRLTCLVSHRIEAECQAKCDKRGGCAKRCESANGRQQVVDGQILAPKIPHPRRPDLLTSAKA